MIDAVLASLALVAINSIVALSVSALCKFKYQPTRVLLWILFATFGLVCVGGMAADKGHTWGEPMMHLCLANVAVVVVLGIVALIVERRLSHPKSATSRLHDSMHTH